MNLQLPSSFSPRVTDLPVCVTVVYGSWFDHILSWEEHQNEMGTLFLYYESMKKVCPIIS